MRFPLSESSFFFRLIIVSGTLLLLALPACAQNDLALAPIGGPGGGRYVARCNDGQYLRGFQLRTADDVDAIRPICASIYGSTEVGPVNIFPNYFGGDGGSERQLVCPDNLPIVTGMLIGYEGQRTTIVNNIRLFCGEAAGTRQPSEFPSVTFDGPPANKTMGSFSGGPGSETQHCPVGYLAVGINGRSGLWLDSVGLICGNPRFTPNPNPSTGVSSLGRVKPHVNSIGRVGVSSPAFIYATVNDSVGSLRWFRHDGATAGKFDWQGPRVVNTGWDAFRLIFPGGDGKIYAVTRTGTLMLYQHAGFNTGLGRDDPKGWLPSVEIATGWSGVTHAFSTGSGIIYAVTSDGKLHWYRVTGPIVGKVILEGPKEIGRGWTNLTQIFSIGDGIIYAITNDGKLRWFRHVGYLRGEGLETPGAWIGPKEVGSGWSIYNHVFATSAGIIYGIDRDGKLMWYHHRGFKDGSMAWDGPKQVGTGWGEAVQVFAQP